MPQLARCRCSAFRGSLREPHQARHGDKTQTNGSDERLHPRVFLSMYQTLSGSAIKGATRTVTLAGGHEAGGIHPLNFF